MNYKLLFILFLTSLTLSCTTQPSLNPDCCIECVNAFSQSPVAVGPSAAACGHFMSGYSMSTQCEEYFRDAAVTVDDCER
ncbi:hypothetical protein HYV86_05880 [Candidatus Woesearchaeota archaeon]|nr:hypothetical protein [Candidatus Woesearchaeota archaeon]